MIPRWARRPDAQADAIEPDATGAKAGRPTWVLHPFLIGVFPILSLYAHNVYETPPAAVAWPIALALSSTFALWLVLRLASGDAAKAGLAASLVVSSFFGYPWLHPIIDAAWSFLSTFWVHTINGASPMVALAMLAVAIGAGFVLIFRPSGSPARLTRFLNAFTLILVALPTVGIASARVGGQAARPREAPLPAASGRGWAPDIYYIVVDGYARSDVMKDLFGLDNAPFLQHLRDLGFVVNAGATSNYCQTRLSVASTLNVDYLDKLVDTSSPDLLPLSGLIRDNLVARLLRPLGYKTVGFSTGFEPTDNPESDVYLAPRPGGQEFSQLLLEMTPLASWSSEVKLEDRYSALRDRSTYLLDRLPTVAKIEGPTFTFAHLLLPHPPFVFGEDGEDVSPRQMLPDGRVAKSLGRSFGTPDYFREAYRKQAAFVTRRVGKAIDQILAASPEPPVIVLMSDHGSWLRYHPDDVEASDLRERFGVLNAVLIPGRKAEGLAGGMTSVNVFRAVLKEVIGADLPPLPDRNFFSNYHDPLRFVDVTERVHSEGERTRSFAYPPEYPGLQQQF